MSTESMKNIEDMTNEEVKGELKRHVKRIQDIAQKPKTQNNAKILEQEIKNFLIFGNSFSLESQHLNQMLFATQAILKLGKYVGALLLQTPEWSEYGDKYVSCVRNISTWTQEEWEEINSFLNN